MEDRIEQVDLDYNGNIVIMAEIDGHSVYWRLTNEEMLALMIAKGAKID